MKSTLLIIITAFSLSSCTLSNYLHDDVEYYNNMYSMLKECNSDEDCIIDLVNSIPDNYFHPDMMLQYMEGYCPVRLDVLRGKGRLTIDEINPLQPIGAILLVGKMGETSLRKGKYGNIYSVRIERASWFPNSDIALFHELLHAKGWWGGEAHGSRNTHSKTQLAIMEEEGVTSWMDTTFYKTEPTTYHCEELWRSPKPYVRLPLFNTAEDMNEDK